MGLYDILYTGCFFYCGMTSTRTPAFICHPILLVDLSISSQYYAQSNEGSIIMLSLICVELQANT